MTTTAVQEHDPTVQVKSDGCRVVCSCGWASAQTLERCWETKARAMDRWYDHFVYQRRLGAAS
jgi:hypothetical protein